MRDENSTLKFRPPAPANQPPLVHFENARRELALASTIDEVRDIRDRAEALRVYCKQAGESLEMQNLCAEIKIRAERRAGEILSDMDKHKGGRPKNHCQDDNGFPRLRDLGIDGNKSSRWQRISEIPEDSFEDYIQTTKSKESELTSSGALLLAREIERQKKIQDIEENIEKSPSLPEQRYEVLVVDPPWEYRLRHDQGDRRNAILYPTMPTEEIKAIPIQQLSAKDSILWLWSTNSHLPDALQIAKEWGFEYKVLLTWVKNRIGTGYWLRGRTEHCIMAIKGHPIVNLRNQSTVLHAPIRAHSQKPDEFYRLVETLCPGRKIELFARENRDGWDTWLTPANISQSARS